MRKIALIIPYLLASVALAGGSMTGGTPPAREKLLEILDMDSSLDGGLFDNGNDIGLLMTKVKLQSQMRVGSAVGGGTIPAVSDLAGNSTGTPTAIRFSADDLSTLRNRTKPIDAVGSEGQNLSFAILAGDSLDTVRLEDRRLIMRASVKSNQ